MLHRHSRERDAAAVSPSPSGFLLSFVSLYISFLFSSGDFGGIGRLSLRHLGIAGTLLSPQTRSEDTFFTRCTHCGRWNSFLRIIRTRTQVGGAMAAKAALWCIDNRVLLMHPDISAHISIK